MKINRLAKPPINLLTPAIIIYSLVATLTLINGCSDSNPSSVQSMQENVSAGVKIDRAKIYDSTLIKFEVNFSFKSQVISDSRMMESNLGNRFNHIVSVSQYLEPGEELDLQELQPTGIFALYLSANETFSLRNSDGMSFSSKTILMEKCSFIDLKLKNEGFKAIQVNGFVAGE